MEDTDYKKFSMFLFPFACYGLYSLISDIHHHFKGIADFIETDTESESDSGSSFITSDSDDFEEVDSESSDPTYIPPQDNKFKKNLRKRVRVQ